MNKIKKTSIIALILLVVGAIGSIVTFQSVSKAVAIKEEKLIKNNTFTNIDINANNDRVEIVSTDDSQATVELVGESREDVTKELIVEQTGDKLSVKVKEQKVFKLFHFMGSDLTLRIALPEKQYKSLQIDIDNGTVQAEQLKIENIHAETSNGEIELKDIEATALKVESDNGTILLENVSGEIHGETDNGEIILETTNLNRPITLNSDNGSITIKTNKEPTNATFDVQVDNGEINIFDKYSDNAVFGDGANKIMLSTDNGEITVTK